MIESNIPINFKLWLEKFNWQKTYEGESLKNDEGYKNPLDKD
jgi:hypothetical protein